MVMPAMNGVPWWFGRGVPALEGVPLETVDPGGEIGRAIAVEHVIGCVVHASTATSEPGLVEHKMGQGLIVGEPAGGESARVRELAALLTRAGFDATVSADVRRDIWYKLWGNMTMNPVSAITGATVDRVLADPLVMAFCSQAMREASAVGARIGCAIEQTPEDRHVITRRLGSFKPSMLQDVEAGRALELDAIVARGARDRSARRRRHAEHRCAARPDAAVRSCARVVSAGAGLTQPRVDCRQIDRCVQAAVPCRNDEQAGPAAGEAPPHPARIGVMVVEACRVCNASSSAWARCAALTLINVTVTPSPRRTAPWRMVSAPWAWCTCIVALA